MTGQPAVDVSHVHRKQGPIASSAELAGHAATTVALDLMENLEHRRFGEPEGRISKAIGAASHDPMDTDGVMAHLKQQVRDSCISYIERMTSPAALFDASRIRLPFTPGI
jgi:hypothetical protein